MKLAMPVSAGRISTALDFARDLLLIEYEDGREVSRREVVVEEDLPLNRARRLQALGTDTLICGALSRSLAEYLTGAGIEMIPFITGTIEQVLAAYLTGALDSARFLMPGSTDQERAEWKTGRKTALRSAS